MPMFKPLSIPLSVLAVTAVAALSGCSSSPESPEAADKPNFTGTGTAPSSSSDAAADSADKAKDGSEDDSAGDAEEKAAADNSKDADDGKKNKIIPVEALDSLWVPALCDNQAGNLEGGLLPENLKAGYPNAAAGLKRNQDDTPMGAYADVNGDGKDEAVIAYVCNQGGVGWPDNLLIYDNDLNYITKVGDDEWKREGMPPARGHIQQLQWTEDTITVTWRAYAPDDAACCATQEFVGDLTLDGDTPHLSATGHRLAG